MNEQQAKALLKKYNDGTASAEERRQVETYFFRYLEKKDALPNEDRLQLDQAEVRARLQAHIAQPATHSIWHKRSWARIVAAACILLVLSAGSYFLLHQRQIQQQTAQNQMHDILPGKNQATLTLANGKQIVLTKQLSGKLAQQGNTTIQASQNAITYIAGATAADVPVTYNTLTTVRGQESPVPLVLADGTKVWLNAASTITFPTAFTGKERLVKITGEVYFEVVHNEKQPFKVTVKGQTIEDIGTAFNINAYDDEPVIKTTLISGSIRLNQSVVLKPDQEAMIAGKTIKVRNVDTEGALAWKNGYFLFDNESLESIMRRVSRWYNVDISYAQGQPITEGFLGSISRTSNVSQVLNMLEVTGHVKFTIDGRKIIVAKK